jgi:hypothetical protein
MSVKFLLIETLNDCIQISVAVFNQDSLSANLTHAIEAVNAGSSENAGVGSLHSVYACICFH